MNYTVYMHISPNNKRYIGITGRKPEHRWNSGRGYKYNEYFYRAICKYGWENFQHIIIAKGLSKEEAEWLEIELIKKWNSSSREYGYNITLGGEGSSGINPYKNKTNEEMDIIKKKMKENHWDCSGENNPNAKAVICITTNKKFFTITEGARYYNVSESVICSSCKGIIKHNGKEYPVKCGGMLEDGTPLVWMYLEDYKNATDKEIQERIKKSYESKNMPKGENSPNAKSIICLTTEKFFHTVTEGAKYYKCNVHSLINCCKGRQKTAGKLPDGTKLVWKYVKDLTEDELKKIKVFKNE